MKKIIIFIILFFLSTFALYAQSYDNERFDNIYNNKLYKPNTIYVVLQPVDYGIGLRYDRMFNPLWGSYISLTHGKFELETGEIIDHHYKVVSGVLFYLRPSDRFYWSYIGLGLSFNGYEGLHNIPYTFPPQALDVWSFEISCNARLTNKFNVGVRIDPLKWESSVDLGFSF